MKRRELIKLGAAGWVMLSQPLKSVAATPKPASKKLVWVVLRGAMDSLHAVVPIGDQYLMQHRQALVKPIVDDLSHFDAQDMLESGLNVTDHNSGWLARAFKQYQQNAHTEALAIARSLPLSMRGEERIRTWYPSSLPDAVNVILDLFTWPKVVVNCSRKIPMPVVPC